MRKHVDLTTMTDGRFYGFNDMVKADTGGCGDCSHCCRYVGDSIVLTPYDVYRLCKGLGNSFESMLEKQLELYVDDGMIRPNLMVADDGKGCVFLNEKGRCKIHEHRPDLCRLFPLGRYYEKGDFHYVLQVKECQKSSLGKVKVKKWISPTDSGPHKPYILAWHEFSKQIEMMVKDMTNERLVQKINMYILNEFYIRPWSESQDFYEEFTQRLRVAQKELGL